MKELGTITKLLLFIHIATIIIIVMIPYDMVWYTASVYFEDTIECEFLYEIDGVDYNSCNTLITKDEVADVKFNIILVLVTSITINIWYLNDTSKQKRIKKTGRR